MMELLRVCLSDTGKLPEILVGCSIEFTSWRGDSWITTEVEVVQHDVDSFLFRDSGKG